jgi:hypothetical protein
VDLTDALRRPGDGNRRGGPRWLRWGPAREGGSAVARARHGRAPIDEVWHYRPCKLRRALGVFRDLLTEKGEPLGGLSPAATKRGKIGEFGGGWLTSRGRAAVGWAMAWKVHLIGVPSRAKRVMTGACTQARSVLYAGRTCVRAAVEQGRARLAAGGVSVKETRSCAACLLSLSRRARWRDVERRRPRGGGARDRGGIGRTLCTVKRKLLAAQRLRGPDVALRVLSGHWCPSEMLRKDGHGVKELCQVAAVRVAHAHEVVGGAVLRPLSARRMSGASVVASSSAAAAICDRRPASGSGRRAPKWWARGSVLGGGSQCARVCRRAGGEDPSRRAHPEAGVAAWARITPASCGARAGELRERGRV